MPSRLNKNGGLNFVFVGFVIMALALSAFTAKAAGEGAMGAATMTLIRRLRPDERLCPVNFWRLYLRLVVAIIDNFAVIKKIEYALEWICYN